MSNTDLYYAQLTNLSVRIAVGMKNRREPLDDLTQALDQLSQTNAIKGNAADAMKAYIGEVHMTLIQTLQLILFNYQAALGNYVTGYLGVDSAENFQLVEEDFDDHEHKLSAHRSDFISFGNKLKAISDEAEDIISLSGAGSKSIFNVVNKMNAMKRTVSNLKTNWNKYDNSYKGFDQVENLIAQTISLLNSTLSVPRGYSYSPGSFMKLINKNFVNAFQVNADYAQNPANQKAVQDNWNKILKNYKVDQDRMAEEAAKEKAKKEGLIGLIWDYVQVQAGAVITVAGLGLAPFSGGASLSLTVLGGSMVIGGINSAINHGSMALTGKGYNLIGNLTNGGLQWYNKNIGDPLVKTGNPIAKFVAGFGNGSIEMVGAMGQFSVYDMGKTIYTLYKDPQARAQFEAKLGNWWDKVRSGDAYTIGQATPMVLSVIVAPDDIGAAASKASKAESLLGKAGTFSKSIAVSSVENVKNIVTLPVRLLDNIGNKAADLGTIFSKGKGLVGDFTKSVVVSSAKNAKNIITLSGRSLDDVKKAAGFVNEKLVPASEKAVKDFGKVLQNTGEDLKGLIRQEEVVTDKGFGFRVGNNIKLSDVGNNFKNGVNDVKDNFVKAIKSGDKVGGNADNVITEADRIKQFNLNNCRENIVDALGKFRKELLNNRDAKGIRKICSTADLGDLNLKGEAGSGIWKYNPTIKDYTGVDPRKFCKTAEDYTKYYRSLLSDEHLESLPDSFWVGKNKEFIKEDMAKLRADIERVKNEAVDEGEFNLYGEPSFEYKWNVDNCAEIWSSRDAILKGARYDDLVYRTENLSGGFAEPCENCQRTFKGTYNIDY